MAGEAAGYSVDVKALSEPTIKDALDSDAYDVVMPLGSTIKSAAGKPTVISDNLIQTPFTLVTTDRRSSMPELGSLRVGMLSSQAGVGETIKQMYPGIEITFFDTVDEGVRAMRAGGVDALLNNSYVWSYTLQKPSYSNLVVVPQNMLSMDFKAGAVDTPCRRSSPASCCSPRLSHTASRSAGRSAGSRRRRSATSWRTTRSRGR